MSWWQQVVDRLVTDGVLVLLVGRDEEPHVRGAYSLLGRTTVREAVALIRRATAVLTCDSFIMHAAHLAGKPAAVVWGPTDSRVYGYPEHVHVCAPDDCQEYLSCIGPKKGAESYRSVCSRPEGHCMERIAADEVYRATCRAMG
jgi:ADP-heptose:LPS heptosyltransferase